MTLPADMLKHSLMIGKWVRVLPTDWAITSNHNGHIGIITEYYQNWNDRYMYSVWIPRIDLTLMVYVETAMLLEVGA